MNFKLNIRTAADLAKKDKAEKDRRKVEEAQAILTETDWYVVRQLETGKPIPKNIATKRAKARKDANSPAVE